MTDDRKRMKQGQKEEAAFDPESKISI